VARQVLQIEFAHRATTAACPSSTFWAAVGSGARSCSTTASWQAAPFVALERLPAVRRFATWWQFLKPAIWAGTPQYSTAVTQDYDRAELRWVDVLGNGC
jgi:hypothetical protein